LIIDRKNVKPYTTFYQLRYGEGNACREGIFMKITKLIGREIYDSRGWPTVGCELTLEDEIVMYAAAPAGLSKSSFEACELRDGGKRLWGRGVSRAIEAIDTVIAPVFLGKEPDGQSLDMVMLELDKTTNKSHLGSNAMIAVSMAVYQAQAIWQELDLFELIAQLLGCDTVTMPFPQFNMINGGMHADNKLAVQEILIVPVGVEHFRSAMELSVTVFHELRTVLHRKGKETCVGDEGGFAPRVSIHEALEMLGEAIDHVSQSHEIPLVIALDCAASQWYDSSQGKYHVQGRTMSTDELIGWYETLVDTYPIYSLEDPFAETDWQGWTRLTELIGERVQIVADDLCATNPERIMLAAENAAMTAAIIKPNQIGTMTETLQAIKLCKDRGINTIVSHRSGETCDTFIADLAVGSSAGQIKAGGCCRSERIAKYNRLLTIEDLLFSRLM
jgi:enolase